MRKWSDILSMYSKPMTEAEFAAFLIRRYSLLSSLIDCEKINRFCNHVYPEYKMCIALIDRLTDKAMAEVLVQLNKSKNKPDAAN